MFEYPISLTLVKQLSDDDTPLSSRANYIREKVLLFNEKSITSPVNSKHIGLGENGENDLVISNSTLSFTLYTTQILNTPAKALRLLSTLLIDSSSENSLRDLICNGKLFRSFAPSITNNEDDIDITNISDSDLIKGLVDVICGTVTANQRQALNEIKQIATRYKLL